jgi:hypothetical protein
MKIQSAKAGIGTGRAGLQAASGLFSNAGLFDKGVKSFHPNDLDPYLLFDAETSMIGTLENPTLDLDPSKQDTLDVITATRAGVATYTDVNGNIASAPANTVRVDHVDGVPMILVEPSSENLVTNSTSFTENVGITKTTGIDAPDGTNTASKISGILSSSSSDMAYSIASTVTSSTQVTGSIYVRGIAGEVVVLRIKRYTGGAYVASGPQTVTLTGDWQRIEGLTMTLGADNTNAAVSIRKESGSTADSVDLWGGQIELGSVSTSVIPTSGSPVTRAADDLVISGSDFDFYNQSEGTTYVETVPKTTTNLPHIFEYHNSSDANANRMGVYLPNVSLNLYVRSSGTTTVSSFLGNINLNQLNRLAASYKVNDVLGSLNGEPEVADTSAAIPSGIDKMHIGNVYNFNFPLNGHIKRLIYWPYHSDSL